MWSRLKPKYSKIDGGLKKVFSIKMAVKPRDYKVCPCGRGGDRRYLEMAEWSVNQTNEQHTLADGEVERKWKMRSFTNWTVSKNRLMESWRQHTKQSQRLQTNFLTVPQSLHSTETLELCKCFMVALLVRQVYKYKVSNRSNLSYLYNLSIKCLQHYQEI